MRAFWFQYFAEKMTGRSRFSRQAFKQIGKACPTNPGVKKSEGVIHLKMGWDTTLAEFPIMLK